MIIEVNISGTEKEIVEYFNIRKLKSSTLNKIEKNVSFNNNKILHLKTWSIEIGKCIYDKTIHTLSFT